MDTDKWTDTELERLEKRIKEQYAEAEKELAEKAAAYFEEYAARFKKEELAMLTTSLTKEEVEAKWVDLYGNNAGFAGWYKNANHAYGQTPEEASINFMRWEYAQLGRGQHWNDMRDQMAQRLTEANEIAAGYINGILPKIYIANSNGVAAIAEQAAMEQGIMGVRFDLVDEYTVRNLMTESSDVRPYKPVNISIDESTRWSKNKLQNALLQGILQGDSIDDIADRFQTVTNMNRSAAIRNARTATTNAQNAGKQDRFADLAKSGCIFSKMWIATKDERTRPEHAEAHNQKVDYNSTFEVGGEELRYPADPAASGWNRYNCRCTMRAVDIRFVSKTGVGQNVKVKERNKKLLTTLADVLINGKTDPNLVGLDKEYMKKLDGVFQKSKNEKITQAWEKYGKNLVVNSTTATDPHFNLEDDPDNKEKQGLYINILFDFKGSKDIKKFQITAEEVAHGIDFMRFALTSPENRTYSATYKNGALTKAVKEDLENMIKKAEKKYAGKSNSRELAINGIAESLNKKCGSAYYVADLFNGYTGADTDYFHDEGYYDDPDNYASECFAGFMASELTNKKAHKFMAKNMRQSYNLYKEIVATL